MGDKHHTKKPMNQRTLRAIIGVMTVLVGMIIFYGTNLSERLFKSDNYSMQNRKEMSNELAAHDQIDQEILSWTYTAKKTTNNTEQDPSEILKNAAQEDAPTQEPQTTQGVSVDAWVFAEIINLSGEGGDLFSSGMHLRYAKHKILADLYDRTQRYELLPYMIEYALQVYDYEAAAWYLQLLKQADPQLERIAPERFLFLATNVIQLNFKNIDELKKTIQQLYESKRIQEDTYIFYDAAVTFAKKDMNNYSYFMDRLQQSPVYSWRYRAYQEDKKLAGSYQDVASYYLQSLVAIRYLQHGYPNIAKTVWKLVLDQDDKYILAHQLVAYGALMLWEWTEARAELERLTQLDSTYKERYLFYKGISQYMEGAYDDAILSFNQVNDPSFKHDVSKYLLLSYSHLRDRTKWGEIAQYVSTVEGIDVYDYFNIFETLFYSDHAKELSKVFDNTQLRTILLDCYEHLPREFSYVCLYGKAWFFLQAGDVEKTYRYLSQLVEWYPLPEFYEQLGILAHEQELDEDAKRRYAKAILSAADEQHIAALKQTFTELFR